MGARALAAWVSAGLGSLNIKGRFSGLCLERVAISGAKGVAVWHGRFNFA